MFSGIVEGMGVVRTVKKRGGIVTFEIDLGVLSRGVRVGDSVCCDGVCLTAAKVAGKRMFVDVMQETLRCTCLGTWRTGMQINLERSLRMSDVLGGHLVFGHVDVVARLVSIKPEGDSKRYRFRIPARCMKLIARKGSVALSGVSLTVAATGKDWLEVCLIPHTLKATTLGKLRTSGAANLELDMFARYAHKLLTGKEIKI